MRFVVSLKRTADQSRLEWKSAPASAVDLAGLSSNPKFSAARGDIEMDPIKPPNYRVPAYEP